MIEVYNDNLWQPLISMCFEMHQESSYKNISFNPDKIKALTSRSDILCVLCKNDDEYVGLIAGIISPYYFSDELSAHDVAFYVKPEHRGSSAAYKLVKTYEEWAISKGVHQIYLAQSSGVDIEKTDLFFNRLGYTKLGSSVKKEV